MGYCCPEFEYAATKYIGHYDEDYDFCPMTERFATIPDRKTIVLSYYDYNVYGSVIIKFCPFCGSKISSNK